MCPLLLSDHESGKINLFISFSCSNPFPSLLLNSRNQFLPFHKWNPQPRPSLNLIPSKQQLGLSIDRFGSNLDGKIPIKNRTEFPNPKLNRPKSINNQNRNRKFGSARSIFSFLGLQHTSPLKLKRKKKKNVYWSSFKKPKPN